MPYAIKPNERFKKINYYDTLLLTSEEFKVEQSYHSMVHQMHNNTFHGAGVAWGLQVSSLGTTITVAPGVALIKVPLASEEHGTPELLPKPVDLTVMVTKEVVITESFDIDISQNPSMFSGVDTNYFLVVKPIEITGYDEVYKGDRPVHAIDNMEFSLVSATTTPNPEVGGECVVLAECVIAGVSGTVGALVFTNLSLTNINSQVPQRKYSGLSVVESETHRLTFSSVENSQASAPAAVFTGAPGALEIQTDALNIIPITGASLTNMSLDGTLSVTSDITGGGNLVITGGISNSGNLDVGGNATINGNLTVLGTQTTLNTTTMQLEDNVITLNRPVTGAVTNPTVLLGTTYSGLEIHEFSGVTPAPASWPALVWDNVASLWKMFDYSGSPMDIGYGAPWDTLAKNHLADTMHVHSFLTNALDPADANYKKSVVVDINGKVGIGTATPANELYVVGSAGISGDLTVNNMFHTKGSSTLDGGVRIKGALAIESVLKTVDAAGVLSPAGLMVDNSLVTINHGGANADAAIKVDRGVDPQAEILWDEANVTWKVSHRDKYTQVFAPIEIATVNQLPKSLAIEKTQINHGFVPGDAVYIDQTGVYKKAQSNSEITTGVFLVVETNPLLPDNFFLAQAGYVDFRAQVINVEVPDGLGNMVSGNVFNPGQYYFVSDTTPGLLTEKEPPGISNPLFMADGPKTGYVLPYRPSESSRDTLKDYIDSMIVGVICPFAMDIPPEGWLECNGMQHLVAAYSRLYLKIGTTYGSGPGGTEFFNVPDLRGQFIRGWSNGGPVDAGRTFASLQDDAIQNHIHDFMGTPGTTGSSLGLKTFHQSTSVPLGGSGGSAIDGFDQTYNLNFAHTHAFTPDGTISNPVTGNIADETRPKNISLMYCIKY